MITSHPGACVRLENKLDRPLIWLACRHHIYELVSKFAWRAALGGNSTSPSEELCNQFLEWWEMNPDVPQTISATESPFIFRDTDPFLQKCRAEIGALAEWVKFDPISAKSSLPHGDYEEFLQLILVCMNCKCIGRNHKMKTCFYLILKNLFPFSTGSFIHSETTV